MDWFERLTGFREANFEETRSRLRIEGDHLFSPANGRKYAIGRLELPCLAELRDRAKPKRRKGDRLRVEVIEGDVRKLHQDPRYAGALFQVASQFNLLEMISPDVTPEDGVARYQYDRTQGPACAIAAGAATIYRNYFVPVGDETGQRTDRQLDVLEDLGEALGEAISQPVSELWSMRNGYALCSKSGIEHITKYLGSIPATALDELRTKLRIGLHWDVEVTDVPGNMSNGAQYCPPIGVQS